MPEAGTPSPLIPRYYRLPLLFLLLGAGVAGNYCKFPLFLNIDFLFGSIFAMLILQGFGLGWGLPAAAVIASYTYILWNHPYAILILTAEVAVVGGLLARRRMGLVLADTIYWLLVGMPLVYLFYHQAMHVPLANTWIVMVKQAMNGIANALLARLLFTAWTIRSRSKLTAFSEITGNLLTFFVLAPTLLLLALDARTDFAATDQRIRAALAQESRQAHQRLETWIANRKTAILTLATLAQGKSPTELQPYLELSKKSDPNLQRIGVINREAISTAFYPLLDELGQKNIGKNYQDRPFIPILKKTLQPMLSEVVLSKVGAPEPTVMVLAPIVRDGAYEGYVAGILGLEQVKAYLENSTEHKSRLYTLIDKNGDVIMTNREGQAVMTSFNRGPGRLDSLGQGLSQWLPLIPANTPVSERWKKSFYVAQIGIGDLSEWQLLLEQPIAPFQKNLYDLYTGKLTFLFLIFLASLALAELLSRRIVAKLKNLAAITRELPLRLAQEGEEIAWPESGIKETSLLIDNFQKMGESLSSQFREVRKVNASLEQRVAERTEQLRKVMDDLNIILENAPIGISKIVDRHQILVNRKTEEMFQYSKQELENQTTRLLYPSEEAYEQLGRDAYSSLSRGELFETVQDLIRKDGAHILVRYIGKALDPKDIRQGTIWLLEDITERRKAEKEREQFYKFFQNSTDMMCIADPNGAFLKTNPFCTELLGYSEAELISRRFIDFVHPEDVQPTLAEMARQIVHGYTLNFENRYLSKDGSCYWLSWRASYDQEEGVTYAIARNITEHKFAQEALLDKTCQLEELTRNLERRIEEEVKLRFRNEQIIIQQSKLAAMGEMLGAISHQWRQPLNALGLIIQNLQDEANFCQLSPEQISRAVEKAMAQIHHMSKTITDFRNFFVPDKEKSQFDTMRAVGDVLSLLSAQLIANNIHYRLTCHTHGKSFTDEAEIVQCGEKLAVGYRNEFEHVVLNLINNAREAILARPTGGDQTPERNGQIDLDFRTSASAIVIEVTDNGGGIAPALLPRIFEPYFTTKDPAKGTGLGLYMSRVIMEQMAGTLSVGNREQGACFVLTLPRPTPPAPEASQP